MAQERSRKIEEPEVGSKLLGSSPYLVLNATGETEARNWKAKRYAEVAIGVERLRFEPSDYWAIPYESELALSGGITVGDELAQLKDWVGSLASDVESVKLALKKCEEGINTILDELREKPIIKQTELLEIDETLEVIKPIPVVIEEYNDEVVAAFPEIEAFGVGSGEAEAIRNLKEEIRRIFFELETISEDELGKLPISWKRVLLKVVKNIGNAQQFEN